MRVRVAILSIALVLLLAASVPFATSLIDGASAGRVNSEVSLAPHRRVGLVLGCAERVGNGSNIFW
jgi:vancomycin permeability regulator SanA